MLHYQIKLMSFQNMSLLELICSRNGNKQNEATSAYKYDRKLFKISLIGLEFIINSQASQRQKKNSQASPKNTIKWNGSKRVTTHKHLHVRISMPLCS